MDLLTGATGFVGPVLARELVKRGRKLRILARHTSDIKALESLDLEIVFGDIRDKKFVESAVKGVENVIHLAFARHGDHLEDIKTNINGTRNLLEACKKYGVKHFLLYSSVTVYGEALEVHENSPFNPYDNYGKSKADVEKMVSEFKKSCDTRITVLRPSYIYGPGDSRNIFQIIKNIGKGRFMIFGSGRNLLNVVYISDVVDVTADILKNKEFQGRDYIISDVRPYPLLELSKVVSNSLSVKKPLKVPYFIGYSAGACLELVSKVTGKNMPLNRSRAKNLTRNRSFRIDRARKEIRYAPKVHLEQGIRKTIDWNRRSGVF